MNAQRKRILSLVLTVCMLVALLPIGMIPASAIEADVATYRYNLHSLQYDEWSTTGYGPSTITSFYKTMWGNTQNIAGKYAANPKQVLGPYTTAMTDPFYTGATSSNAGWAWGDKAYTWMTAGASDSWTSLHVLVPTGDTYSVVTNLGVWASGASKVALYIAPANAENPRDAQYKVGGAEKFENLNGPTNWDALQTWGSVTLDAGEYIVSYVQVGAGYMLNGSLTLTGTKAQETLTITPNYGTNPETSEPLTSASVENGSTATLPLSIAINGTPEADWSGMPEGVVVESANPSIATAVLDGENLVITGTGVGTTSINVRMNVFEIMGWVEIPVETTASETYRVLTVTANSDLSKLYQNKTATSTLKAFIDTVDFNFTGATVNATVEPADLATASVAIDAEGVATLSVTPTNIGSGTIHIDATVDGVNDTLDIPFTADHFALNYNFMRFQYGAMGSLAAYSYSLAPEGVTAAPVSDIPKSWGWEKTAPNTNNIVTDPFIWGTPSLSGTNAWLWTYSSGSNLGPAWNGLTVGDSIAYQLRVSETGNYTPSITNLKYAAGAAHSGAVFDVYLAPTYAANPLADIYKVGSSNTSAAVAGLAPDTLNSTPLAKGDYTMTMKLTSAGEGATATMWIFTKDFHLTDNNTSKINLGDGSDVTVNVGETQKIAIGLANTATTTIETSNANVATAAFDANGDLVISGVAFGSAKIFVRATDGEAAGAQVYNVSSMATQRTMALTAAPASLSVMRTKSASSTLGVTIDLAAFNFTGATVNATVEPASLGTATVDIDESGVATVNFAALADGTGNINITATVDGVEGTLAIPVTVTPLTYNYNFMRLQWGEWSEEGYALNNDLIKSWGWETTAGNFKGRSTDPFIWASGNATWAWTSSSASNGPNWSPVAAGETSAIKIRVAEDGVYTPSTTVLKYVSGTANSGASFDVFLAPDGVADPAAATYKVGVLNSSGTAVALEKTSFANTPLAAGDYILTYNATSAGEGATATSWVFFKDVQLQDNFTASWINMGAKAVTVTPSGTKTVVTGLSAGAEVNVVNFNDTVATAAVSEGNLVISAVSGGTADIYVSIKDGTSMGAQRYTVTIANPATSISLNENLFFLAQGGGCPLSATVLPANADDKTVTWSSSNDAVATVTDGNVTAVGAGTAIITAKTVNDLTATATITVTNAENFYYRPGKAHNGQWSTSTVPFSSVTLAMTTKGSPTELTSTYRTLPETDPWAFGGASAGSTYAWTESSPDRGYSFATTSADSYISFKIRVPKDDTFKPGLIVTQGSGFGSAELFIAPVSAADDRTNTNYRVGSVDFNAKALTEDVKQSFSNVSLTAGDYLVTFKGAIVAGFVEEISLTKVVAPAVELETYVGAQIRTTGVQGLRFISKIVKNSEFAKVVEYGTVLIPSADITSIEELVIGATLNGHDVAKVPAVLKYTEDAEKIEFTAVITNVAVENYNRAYTARAYAIYEDTEGVRHTVYGATFSSRSVAQVASNGLNDPNVSEADRAVFQGILDAIA